MNPSVKDLARKSINHSAKDVSKKFAGSAIKKYNENREEHAKLYKDNNPQNLRETHSEAVLTFSEAIDTDLGNKYTLDELILSAKKTVKDMADAMNTEALFITLHLDEKRPHFHAFFKNYGDKGQSIMFENRTRDKLSALQDIMYENFKVLGM